MSIGNKKKTLYGRVKETLHNLALTIFECLGRTNQLRKRGFAMVSHRGGL